MRHPYMTNADRLRSAQMMHDRATDDRPDDFIDTLEGQQWLSEAADDLASGINQTWKHGSNSQLQGVTYAQLEERIKESDCDEWMTACDAFLASALRDNDDDRQAMEIATSALKAVARRIASEMLAPWANSWAEYQDAMMAQDDWSDCE